MNIGERVGDYEIVAVLGAGGMGQVYKVRNVLSERIEAMKVLLPNMSSDPDLAQRFLREIQVQATLDHPNIARLHTAQQFGNQLVMIMEFVEGDSIEKLLEHGAVPVTDSVNYVSQVLDALAYAHARGVIHRDVKPANIMRTPSGVIKLMDFGIARMQKDRRLTQTGMAVGSLFYMSPEQIQGGEPDPRSDLYALGVTLYEMVTGRKPFQGDSEYSIMAAHMQQVPAAPIEIVPGVSSDLSEIILMAIAKDPATRFQSAEAFHGALRSLGLGQAAPMQAAAPQSMPAAAPSYMKTAPMPLGSPASAPSAAAYSAPPPVRLTPPPAGSPVVAAKANSGSRRGLYMALGSMATIAALAIALIEVPKFRNAHAGQSDTKADPPAATITPQPQTPPDPAPAPAAAEAAPPEPAPVSNPTPTPTKSPSAALRPQQPPSARPQAPPAAQVQAAQVQSAPVQQAPQATPQPPAPTQAVAAQPVQAQPVQAQPVPAQPVPAQPARASAAEINELRQQYNLLSVRAGTAKSGLQSMQQQMARQGLNLRGDMVEAQGRMDLQMREAMEAIRSGDAEQARSSLLMAERAAQSIEKFLGR